MNVLIKYLIFLAIIFIPFQGVYKPAFLGFLSSSPSNLIFLICIFLNIFSGTQFARLKKLAIFLIWPFIVSIISISIFGFNSIYSEKILPLFVGNLLWTSPFILINYIDFSYLRKSLSICFVITILGIVLFDFNIDKFEWLYNILISPDFNFYKYQLRLTGFSTEPLQLAQLTSHISLALYLIDLKLKGKENSKLNLSFILFLMFNIILSYYIGSKGTFFFLIISLVFSLDFRSLFNIKYLFYISFIGTFLYVAVKIYIDETINNYYLYYSFTTRIVFFITSIIAFFKNPFGYGYYGFYGAIIENSNNAIAFLSDKVIGNDLNLSEVYEITDEVLNVSTKSGFADYLLTHGVVFLYALYLILRNLDFNNFYCRFSIIFIMISSLTASTNEVLITIFVLTIITKIFNKNNFVNFQKKQLVQSS